MKKLLTALFVALATISSVNASNSILKLADPNFLYLADPAAEVYNGRLYLYCSHDHANAADYSQMQDYAIVSTDDGQAYIYGNDHKIRFNKDEKRSFIYGAKLKDNMIELDGKWYIFYQRGDMNEGTFHRRSACFEEIQFDDNHNILPVTYTLGEGVELVNPLVTPW